MHEAHDHHESLPGYHPDQILHDGCGECERRAENPAVAIEHMDAFRFQKAWQRARDWGKGDAPISTRAAAEKGVVDTLWIVQVQLERRGIPIGELPGEMPPF